MLKRVVTLAALMLLAGTSVGSERTEVWLHGKIFTGSAQRKWAEAMAVRGEEILAVGSDAQVQRQWGRGATQRDLKGRTVIPGIVDSHVHLLFGAYALHGLNLSGPHGSITPEKPQVLIDRIRAYAAAHPQDRVIFVRADFSSVAPFFPERELLDRALSDRPVVVHNMSEHALWVNGAALRMAGLGDDPLADPIEERGVMRDASGHPTGIFLEAGMDVIDRAVEKLLPQADKLEYLQAAVHYLNSFGITSVVNATGSLDEMGLLAKLHERGQLTVRTRTALGAVAVPHRLTPEFLATVEQARKLYHDDWVSANLVKFFADGGTGLIPPLVYEPHEYERLISELDRRGVQVMTHAVRTDSIHMVLDTYQHVIEQNGPRDRRLRIEHVTVATPSDIQRMGSLSIIGSMQPVFCCGENGYNYDTQHPVVTDAWASVQASGATLAFGSDWPCQWPADPFAAIRQAATREVWKSADTDNVMGAPLDGAAQAGAIPTNATYTPQEHVSVEQSILAYTVAGAYAAFWDDRVGSLEPGKKADFVVLSQDIFNIEPRKVSDTRVLETWVGGRQVYRAGSPAL
jgi:predicted amidohydrolase YtcJ